MSIAQSHAARHALIARLAKRVEKALLEIPSIEDRRTLIDSFAASDLSDTALSPEPKKKDAIVEPPVDEQHVDKGPVVIRDDRPLAVIELLAALSDAASHEIVKSLGERVVSIRKLHKDHADTITNAYNDALAKFPKKVA